MRYMLVDGQGNFGSIDGDNAAAMRYTEIRLAKIAHELLADIDQETVDFGPNYDGSEQEPLLLPSRLPNLLVNGSSGIAVGMATNIPPHNLQEVVDGCLYCLRNPNCTVDELIELIPAPDFPTGGIIYGMSGVREGYRTGRGRVIMRAKTHFEDLEKGNRQAIVVDAIPYQVNKKTLQERIAELVNDKKIEGISDIRDESDKDGMRLVIELKRGEVPEVVLNNLYKNTQLQDTFGMNLVALVDGQPRLLNLKQMLDYFLQHRREVVTRRTVFQLRGARARSRAGRPGRGAGQHRRLHRHHQGGADASRRAPGTDGAFMGFVAGARDAVTRRWRHAGRPRGVPSRRPGRGVRLAGRWNVSPERYAGAGNPEHAPAAPDRPGAGQDRWRIQGHHVHHRRPARHPGPSGAHHHHHWRGTAGHQGRVLDRRQDTRRSDIELNATELDTEDLITPTDMVVTLSHGGYIKSQPLSEYRSQKRGGRGKQATAMKENDWIDQLFIANTHDFLLCFSNRGRVYWLKVWEVPQGTRNSRGKPIVNMFPLADGEKITVVLPVKEFSDDHYVFMATTRGTVKKTPLSDFSNPRKAGIIAVDLDDGDYLIGADLTDGKHDVMLFSDAGKAVRFDENDVRPMGRNARACAACSSRTPRR